LNRRPDEPALAVALSGGGIRAAALPHGVMQERRDTRARLNGREQSPLDPIEWAAGARQSLQRLGVPAPPAISIIFRPPRIDVDAAARRRRNHRDGTIVPAPETPNPPRGGLAAAPAAQLFLPGVCSACNTAGDWRRTAAIPGASAGQSSSATLPNGSDLTLILVCSNTTKAPL
jgi:hypothetical protein